MLPERNLKVNVNTVSNVLEINLNTNQSHHGGTKT